MTVENLHLQLHFTDSYQPLTDTVEKTVTLELFPEQIRNGMITQLSNSGNASRNFTVLLAIASFMNTEQKAFPSQETLAEITGLSIPTLRKALTELTEIKVNEQPILRKSAVGRSTVYQLVSIAEKEDVQEETEVKVMTSKDVLILFCDYYAETFDTEYVPAWGRELGQIKQKLIGKFADEDLHEIVRIAVTQYKQHWANQQYPLPTIGQLTSWLANKANAVWQVEKEKQKQYEQRIAEAEKVEQIDSAALLDL